MRLYKLPYNGQRYLLNQNTGEIHDRDNETDACKINEIKPDHVYNCDSYSIALIATELFTHKKIKGNGCYHCLKGKDQG